jgi:hypothetical protein
LIPLLVFIAGEPTPPLDPCMSPNQGTTSRARVVSTTDCPLILFRRRDSNPDKRIQNPLSCH